MIDTNVIRNKILELAMQGKLVEQRAEEGTAETLYAEIQTEKQKLIAEGKIKKEKPLAPITDDEKLFEIPESWMWVRLGNLFCLEMGQSPEGITVSEFGEGIEFHQGKVCFGTKYLNVSPQRTSAPTKFADKNSVLLCVRAPVGKVNITNRKICIGRGLCAVKALNGMSVDFVYYWLATLENTFVRKATGATFVAITGDIVRNQVLPLPPLAEQHRIVDIVSEIFRALDVIDDLQSKYASDCEVLKSKLLDLAIHGKLVEQRDEEGTAETLYAEIQAEKQKLIAEGKIKEEKPLEPITDDEKPFEIPESWQWVRLGEIFSHNTGKAQNSSGSNKGIMRKFITTSNLYWNYFDFTKIKEMPFTEQELKKCTVKKGDLLVCEGGDCGRSAIWNFDYDVCIQNHIHRLRQYKELSIDYFYYLLYFYKHTGKLKGQGVAILGLSSVAIHKILLPLPPLAEQHRIVAKLEELLPLCDKLK